MARLTKHESGLTVETFYGINRSTLEVESVQLRRDGTLVRYSRDMVPQTTWTGPGRFPRSEVTIVFGLSDVVSVPVGATRDHEQRVIEDLKRKAGTLKAEAGKPKDGA